MKRELQVHLIPLLVILLITSLIWILNSVAIIHIILLFLGLVLGAFLLDLDHLIYWLLINPKDPNSQLATTALKKYDFNSILKLYQITRHSHTNLVFHHFFFQIILTFVSVFVFSLSGSAFILGFLLAINLHLLVDQIDDYYTNKEYLQSWLFARENKQLPQKYLGHYIIIFVIILIFLYINLLQSIIAS